MALAGTLAKEIYPTASLLVVAGSIVTTCGFHVLADYPPGASFWFKVVMDTLFSSAISLIAWAFVGAMRLQDVSLQWCLLWSTVAATSSLALATGLIPILQTICVVVLASAVQWLFISVGWMPYPRKRVSYAD